MYQCGEGDLLPGILGWSNFNVGKGWNYFGGLLLGTIYARETMSTNQTISVSKFRCSRNFWAKFSYLRLLKTANFYHIDICLSMGGNLTFTIIFLFCTNTEIRIFSYMMRLEELRDLARNER